MLRSFTGGVPQQAQHQPQVFHLQPQQQHQQYQHQQYQPQHQQYQPQHQQYQQHQLQQHQYQQQQHQMLQPHQQQYQHPLPQQPKLLLHQLQQQLLLHQQYQQHQLQQHQYQQQHQMLQPQQPQYQHPLLHPQQLLHQLNQQLNQTQQLGQQNQQLHQLQPQWPQQQQPQQQNQLQQQWQQVVQQYQQQQPPPQQAPNINAALQPNINAVPAIVVPSSTIANQAAVSRKRGWTGNSSGQSQRPKMSPAIEKEFTKMFGSGLTTDRLYSKLKQMAGDHRSGSAPRDLNGDTEAQRFENFMKDPAFKAAVEDHIRVSSIKENPNDPRGAGLDELFRTGETLKWFQRAAGMVHGVEPTSTVKMGDRSVTFDWLDLQQHVRVGTENVVFKDGHGHVGALWLYLTGRKGGQYATQGKFHDDRNEPIQASKSPLDAYQEALLAHISLTGNQQELENVLSQKAVFNVKGLWSGKADHREVMVAHLTEIRNQLKRAFAWIGGDTGRLPSPVPAGPNPLNRNFPQDSYFQDIPMSKIYRRLTEFSGSSQ